MNIFELSGKMSIDGLDKANQELSGLEKNTQNVQKGMKVMGAAFTAVGVAGLAIIQSTKKINADLSVTAMTLGITTKEMRDLTLATTNVTFPINEVTASFDLLARAGIKDTEVLQATATAFDTLGDALSMSASQVTEVMVPAMKTFRLSAEEIAGKTDMMTYMVRNSTISLDDFNTMVGYTSQEMVDAGLTIDDLAAAMMYMSDSGVEPGKVMLREWNKAVTQSEKEGIALTEALGMTSTELETYKGKLEGAVGITQEYADVANEQYTILDKLRQKWSEVTLKASAFLEPLEPILAGMTALGPLMIFLSTQVGINTIKWIANTGAMVAHNVASAVMHPLLVAKAILIKAVTAATWLWNVALTALVTQIAILVAGLALLGFGIYSLIKHHTDWNKVAEAATKVQDELAKSEGKVTEEVLLAQKAYNELRIAYGQLEGEELKQIERSQEIIASWEDGTYAINETTGALELVADAQKTHVDLLLEEADAAFIAKYGIEAFEEALGTLTEETDKAIDKQKELLEILGKLFPKGMTMEELQLYAPLIEGVKVAGHEPGTAGYYAALGIGGFAGGGVIDKPTLALLGEQAPRIKEYVFNEEQLGAFGMNIPKITLPKFGGGGLIPEPTLLYGLRSQRPYAIAGEAGIEHVGRGTGEGGYRTANIYFQVDGKTLAQVVGQPLIDEIRVKTGVKL